ncbi:MAG: hypothetical protein K8R91_04095, partial [Phycisphaerae bacterium]|nr:hypothetical protein [Phycisphaerae bacterium]
DKLVFGKNDNINSDENPYYFLLDKDPFDDKNQYYGLNNQLINISSYPTCQEKYKYFTCLDTAQKEEVFDWTSWSWKESDETIKIKFAFAIPK